MTPPMHTTRYEAGQHQQFRPYAMVSDGHSKYHHHKELRWPEITSANAVPTPYQIFNQKKGSKYSKQRFYELVKIYHPDRHDPGVHDDLSYDIKLERYRLVVAANDILSDPVKRSAYDYYGAGWNGMADVRSPQDNSDSTSPWGSYSGRGWSGGPDGPSQNATWEDWERWYQRDSQGAQQPRYVSNSAFVALIVIFAALGGVGQATRVGNYSMSFIEQRDALHDSISKDLMRRRRETTNGFGSREERIQQFLKQRDPYGYGVMDPKEESYRRMLPPPKVCSSDEIKTRSMEVYHPKNVPRSD